MASLLISKFGENLPVTGLVAFSQAAVGVGVGLLVADKLEVSARQRTAIALISAGAAAIVPFIAGIYDRISHSPDSSWGMRRRLNSIREGEGFNEDLV